jgi:PAS domain S-box-containing protein
MAILSGKEHIFELVNKSYYQLVGHRDILGKPIRIALPDVAGQGYFELLDGVFHTGEPVIGKEMKVQLQVTPAAQPEEHYVDFVYQARRDAAGAISGVFVHGVDVTDLVLARQESEARAQQIKQQAQAFDTTLTNILDFVYTFDREGRFTYSNKPLLDLLGISLEDIVGKSFYDLPYPEDLAATLQAYIAQVVATGQQVRDETPYISPTGKAGYYEYIFTPVFGDDGQVAVVAGSTRDITERIQQERQKDEFLGIVSHELKTPVTSIKAYTQILQKRLAREGNMSVAAHLARMDGQINKLIVLINDLLDVTKINNGKLQFNEADFAFDDVVVESIEEMQRTTEKHRILLEGATNQIIRGDKDRIGQALVNLLSNAVKYSPHADTILVRSSADDTQVTLCVQDFGMGISVEQQPFVFDRFYRANGEESGTVPGLGLGLYITSEIIKRHGGTIGVESETGRGATFCFTLPIAADQKTNPRRTTPPITDAAPE